MNLELISWQLKRVLSHFYNLVIAWMRFILYSITITAALNVMVKNHSNFNRLINFSAQFILCDTTINDYLNLKYSIFKMLAYDHLTMNINVYYMYRLNEVITIMIICSLWSYFLDKCKHIGRFLLKFFVS